MTDYPELDIILANHLVRGDTVKALQKIQALMIRERVDELKRFDGFTWLTAEDAQTLVDKRLKELEGKLND